jgi:hypothetical protein
MSYRFTVINMYEGVGVGVGVGAFVLKSCPTRHRICIFQPEAEILLIYQKILNMAISGNVTKSENSHRDLNPSHHFTH